MYCVKTGMSQAISRSGSVPAEGRAGCAYVCVIIVIGSRGFYYKALLKMIAYANVKVLYE